VVVLLELFILQVIQQMLRPTLAAAVAVEHLEVFQEMVVLVAQE
jgi:hypothetical protein